MADLIADTFGELLRFWRKHLGYSQRELAELARVGSDTISDLERGRHRTPRQDTAVALVHALGLTGEHQRQFWQLARPASLPTPVPLFTATSDGENTSSWGSFYRPPTALPHESLMTLGRISLPQMGEASRMLLYRFIQTYYQFSEFAAQQSLRLILWTPDNGRGPVAQKRQEIKDTLASYGQHAPLLHTILPADSQPSATPLIPLLPLFQEMDLIILLVDTQPHAILEAIDYFTSPLLTDRCLLLLPTALRARYQAEQWPGITSCGGGVIWYDEEQLQACLVKTQAVRRVLDFCAFAPVTLQRRLGREDGYHE